MAYKNKCVKRPDDRGSRNKRLPVHKYIKVIYIGYILDCNLPIHNFIRSKFISINQLRNHLNSRQAMAAAAHLPSTVRSYLPASLCVLATVDLQRCCSCSLALRFVRGQVRFLGGMAVNWWTAYCRIGVDRDEDEGTRVERTRAASRLGSSTIRCSTF
jgi:hypothetical protein